MGKFVISQNKVGMYGFCLKAGNGQVILFSEDYSTEASCLNGIESVKKNSYNIDGFEGIQNKLLVKQCALICVDEQIKSLKKYEQFETFELHKELLKVKQHLNNL